MRETFSKISDFIARNKLLVGAIFLFIIIFIVLIFLLYSEQNASPQPDTALPELPTTDGDDGQQPVDQDPITDDDGQTPSTEATITWWGAFLSEDVVEPVIQEYESANPGVDIVYQPKLSQGRNLDTYYQQVETEFDEPSESAPDIIMLDGNSVGRFRNRLIEAPSNIYTTTKFTEDFYDFTQEEYIFTDSIYGTPLWADTVAMIYNVEMWEEAGLTSPSSLWNEFEADQLPVLTTELEVPALSIGTVSNNEFWFETINTLLLQGGSNDFITEDGLMAVAGDEGYESAIEFYSQMDESANWNENFNIDVAAFLEGQLATYIAPSWRLDDLLVYNDAARLNLDIAVSPIPQLEPDNPSGFAFSWGNVVNQNSRNSDIAWDFIAFLNSQENITTIHSTLRQTSNSELGLISPRKDMSSEYANYPFLQPYASTIVNAESWSMQAEYLIKPSFEPLVQSGDLESVQTEVNELLSGI